MQTILFDYSDLLGLMKKKGITQEQLSRKIHISPATLSLKLNNKRDFTQYQICRIAKALGIENVNIYFFSEKL